MNRWTAACSLAALLLLPGCALFSGEARERVVEVEGASDQQAIHVVAGLRAVAAEVRALWLAAERRGIKVGRDLDLAAAADADDRIGLADLEAALAATEAAEAALAAQDRKVGADLDRLAAAWIVRQELRAALAEALQAEDGPTAEDAKPFLEAALAALAALSEDE